MSGSEGSGPTTRGLIAFSLWGNDPLYLHGAVHNIRCAAQIYPGYCVRFYTDAPGVLDAAVRLVTADPDCDVATYASRVGGVVEVVEMPSNIRYRGMFWRFLAAADQSADPILFRDSDSRLNPREAAAVAAWLASGHKFHVMHDHPYHADWPILGGMWGVRGGVLTDMEQRIATWGAWRDKTDDMRFLGVNLWPEARADVCHHSSVSTVHAPARPFPPHPEWPGFVGEIMPVGQTDWRPATLVLLTVFYPDPDPARRAELRECLRRNARNGSIHHIRVLVEEPADRLEVLEAVAPEDRPKLQIQRQVGRPTFERLFAYANAQFPGQKTILANADIYFDTTLQRLADVDLAGKMLCLSRWDVLKDGSRQFFDHPASQDAWIFLAPLRFFRCDFPLGVPACDNRLAWEAGQSGLSLSNPSRSVHANHLHHSGTRRYSERDRVRGPTREVPPGSLGGTWMWFAIATDGSADLGTTMSSLVEQPCSTCVIVGNSATDAVSSNVLHGNRDVSIMRLEATSYTPGQAWNRAAGDIDDGGIICFLFPGTTVAAGLSEQVISHLEKETLLIPGEDACGRVEWLACSKADFLSVGGFDSSIVDPSEALSDLRSAFRRARMTERRLNGVLPSRQAKTESMIPDRADTDFPAPGRLASVAFHEDMGCTVTRLTRGASSHNNDFRPINDVPDVLLGRVFTQAVSCSVSPMSLRFLDGGKLFVLVGTDWYGYHPATEWLSGRGTREPLAQVKTERGTGFEVWSVSCQAGEQIVIPTQVVLVGDRFVRA